MKIRLDNLDEVKIKDAATQQFPSAFTKFDKTDLFMEDVADGTYACDFLDHPIYISTQYAYEDIMVKNNPTRYKLHVNTLELLDSEFKVNYSWKDKYYVIFEENDQITFMEYLKFLEYIKQSLKLKE